ncbi:MAG: hypothetical protein NE334_02335 [Lentisphaeraceae bacterium]|nr:hypothetical protein [Lentisphaeraceae bacterium]
MKIFLIVAFPLAIALTAFGWWGLKTKAGREKFDEMDGIYTLFSYYSGLFLLITLVGYITYRKFIK